MAKFHLGTVICLVCWTEFALLRQATNSDQKLLTDLTKGYNKELLPMKGRNKLLVNMSMAIESIIGVNEKEQHIVTRAIFIMNWRDDYLKWDPRNYNGVDFLSLPADRIWRPDIIILNVIDDESYKTNIDESKNRMLLDSDGSITWWVRKTMKTSCPINVANFPYDAQTCAINVASWTYDADTLDYGTPVSLSKVEEPVFVNNNQWAIGSLNSAVKDIDGLLTVHFNMRLHRRPLFYKLNLILPAAVLAFLLNLVFLLPVGSGERMGMCLTLLLSQVVFMLVVGEMMPKSSFSVPIVGIYFIAIFFQMVFVIIAMCCIIKCYHREAFDPPVSGCMRYLVLNRLSYLVGVRRRIDAVGSLTASDVHLREDSVKELTPMDEKSLRKIEHKIDVLLSVSKNLDKNLKQGPAVDVVVQEWRIVGSTLDRLLFGVFLLALIIITIVCFTHDHNHS